MVKSLVRTLLFVLGPLAVSATTPLTPPEISVIELTAKAFGEAFKDNDADLLQKLLVREYCERRKLAAARGFLIASDLSVKETDFRLGFRSPQHFSRWFRARAGLSPSGLRRNGDPVI